MVRISSILDISTNIYSSWIPTFGVFLCDLFWKSHYNGQSGSPPEAPPSAIDQWLYILLGSPPSHQINGQICISESLDLDRFNGLDQTSVYSPWSQTFPGIHDHSKHPPPKENQYFSIFCIKWFRFDDTCPMVRSYMESPLVLSSITHRHMFSSRHASAPRQHNKSR